jgi:hypothetical protein
LGGKLDIPAFSNHKSLLERGGFKEFSYIPKKLRFFQQLHLAKESLCIDQDLAIRKNAR